MEDGRLPEDIENVISKFDTSLTKLEDTFDKMIKSASKGKNQAKTINEMNIENTLDRAKVEMVGAYTINSLFWMLTNVNGEKLEENSTLHQQLERLHETMDVIRDVNALVNTKRMTLDSTASKRLVKNSLWNEDEDEEMEGEGEKKAGQASSSAATPKKSKNKNKRKKM